MRVTEKLKNSHQVVRYAIVGITNTAIDFVLLFALIYAGLDVIVANIIATGFAFTFSFYMNRKYTFEPTDSQIVREIALFTIVTLIGLWGLQTLVMSGLEAMTISIVHNHTFSIFIDKIIATGVSMTWNYLLYKTVVFPRKKTD